MHILGVLWNTVLEQPMDVFSKNGNAVAGLRANGDVGDLGAVGVRVEVVLYPDESDSGDHSFGLSEEVLEPLQLGF